MTTNNSCNFGEGTSSQVLTSNGAGLAPTFQAPAPQPGHPIAVDTSMPGSTTAVVIPWVVCTAGTSLAITDSLSNASIYLVPMYLDQVITYTKIGIQVTNTPGAGSTVDLVIYDNSASGGLPGVVLISSTGLSSAAAGLVEGTISFSPSAGYYWMGVQRNATAAVSVAGYANSDSFGFFTNRALISLSNPTNAILIPKFLGATNTYGTYGNNPTITSNGPANAVPLIYLR